MALTFGTIQEKPDYSLHGPPGLRQFFECGKYYDKRQNREPLALLEYHEDCKPFSDANLKVQPVLLQRSINSGLKRKLGDQSGHDASVLNTMLPSDRRLAYICQGPTKPGKFDVSAAKALGLAPGPAVKDLKQGKAIVLENGTIIRPEQCVSPDVIGKRFLILDCPSIDFMDSIRTKLNPSILNTPEQPLSLIVHMIENRLVFENETYQSWISGFGPDVQVILIRSSRRE